jgi:transposase InsO family protein
MLPWRASSVCCRRTFWTAADGTTREELRIAIVTWIEQTYHRRRRQAGLGRLTPIEYELSFTNDTLTAVS